MTMRLRLRPQLGRHRRRPLELREGETLQGEYPRGAWAPIRRPVNGSREGFSIPRFGADENDIDHLAEEA
jgi:hypothetical protein